MNGLGGGLLPVVEPPLVPPVVGDAAVVPPEAVAVPVELPAAAPVPVLLALLDEFPPELLQAVTRRKIEARVRFFMVTPSRSALWQERMGNGKLSSLH
jgi:hypothetical protein